MLLRYMGGNAFRDGSHTITSAQFAEAQEGLQHEKVVWNKTNDWTAEVSDEAGQMLLQKMPKHFKEVKQT